MWYRFAKKLIITASRAEYLQSIGASPEAIAHLDTLAPDASKYLTNALRQNPGHSPADLQNLWAQQQQKAVHWSPRETAITQTYQEPYRQWALTRLREQRTGRIPGSEHYNYRTPLNEMHPALQKIHDWHRDTGSQIHSYDYDRAQEQSDIWHKTMAGEGEGLMYERANPEHIVHGPNNWQNPQWNGWTMQKVTSPNDLSAEGNKMNHCVGSYAEQVQEGATNIYSLRDPKNEPHVTVEVDNYHNVNQIFGHNNEEPKDEHKEKIKEWFKKNPHFQHRDEDFDLSSLEYANYQDVPAELDSAVYSENAYGIKKSLSDIDIEYCYKKLMDRFGGHRGDESNYYSWMGNSAPILAKIAFDHDVEMLAPYANTGEEGTKTTYSFYSKKSALNELSALIDKHFEEFNDSCDDYDNQNESNGLERDDYEDEEEYEEAYSLWETKADEERQKSQDYDCAHNLPTGFDLQLNKSIEALMSTRGAELEDLKRRALADTPEWLTNFEKGG